MQYTKGIVSQMKKRAGNSTRIARRACPLRIKRATICDARNSVPSLRSEPVPAATAAILA